MSFASLLIHHCDIYHLQEQEIGGGFGIPTNHIQDEYVYGAVPDLSQVECYWERRDLSNGFILREPYTAMQEVYTVYFPIETDVRLNDKAMYNGVEYRLTRPEPIHNHHIEVIAVRLEESI
ncbi:DUF3599 family protein [Aneurinibacillus migulanus]|uniref:Uncharacterized protein n=1 Tax=Aneurinibacillus migulanus TaxID=47500 RepID=A0A0D1VL49_ANEMI|nr:DUF3599 family protein [Aneurinibacillus migulanus]KIV60284.1 hypothetical protein TS65_00415 [Aneurinibacillus migulanus]KON90517.1 hypothetical protein AF333_28990 [Aneurinibacillus migulanus]MED0894900.1 DUF3599 family protein [Aneurinibacillus migulanus]MED1614457.1 DUF3599 family protein [Aneurinibacillus migulanus]SDJ77162.1 protein of unknown function [Aneurinibacillus migulanus]